MKESEFVGQNKEKWRSLETLSDTKVKNVDDLEEMYLSLTDHLAYSRTHFPNRSIKVYLNQIAQRLHLLLYPKRKFDMISVVRYFKDEVPSIIYSARKEMLLSLLLLLFGVTIGVFSSIQDKDFPPVVLGERYVAMTKANIESGKPMAVYEGGRAADGFIYILWNNAKIDLLVFALGLLFSLGTIYILLSNAVMLGAFQYFFYNSYAFKASVLTIWMHGTIEISTLVLVGGAGIMAGKGWFFPGTLSRGMAYRVSAFRSLKVLLAVLPMTFVAAFIEAFVTRQTGLPDALKIIIIAGSLVLIIGYFVVLPYRKRLTVDEPIANLKPFLFEPNWRGVKSQSQMISTSFLWMKQNLGKVFNLSFLLSLGVLTYLLIKDNYYLNYSYFREDLWLFKILKIVRMDRYFEINNGYYFFLMLAVFSLIQFQVILSCPISQRINKVKQKVLLMLGLLLINMLSFWPLYLSLPWQFIWFFVAQLVGWQLVLFLIDRMNVNQIYFAFIHTQLRLLVFILPLFLIGAALFLLIGSPVINFVVEIILTIIPLPQQIQMMGNKVLVTFAIWLVFLMELGWIFRATALFYLSENERIFGHELKKELTKHGLG